MNQDKGIVDDKILSLDTLGYVSEMLKDQFYAEDYFFCFTVFVG